MLTLPQYLRLLGLLLAWGGSYSPGFGQTQAKKSVSKQHPVGLQEGTHQAVVKHKAELPYLLYLPEEYKKSAQPLPLIMYLHGGSARGNDLNKVKRTGLPALLVDDKHFPFVVLAPQCPNGEIWTDAEGLISLLDNIVATYRIDPSRIYLTGHSMGGRGTWYLAYRYPTRFAAIAPMSALSTIESWADSLARTPVWAVHGAKDEAAPISNTEVLVNRLKAMGGNVHYTVLSEADHFILDQYKNKALYDWFLSHRKSSTNQLKN
ncbi:carboxylesterase family protein [Telluribacter humicola]|uniref:carboxylesterase family protein n=1 Tax=Telluribacter humicola TaxID=1720261 RepID=UPI001A97B4BB|nr:PHB depolymerase family esterase [Telluribacter humicola]